jgi:hypothetical protein
MLGRGGGGGGGGNRGRGFFVWADLEADFDDVEGGGDGAGDAAGDGTRERVHQRPPHLRRLLPGAHRLRRRGEKGRDRVTGVRKEESERLGGVVVWLLEEKEAVWLLASEARPGAAASCCLAAWWARPAWVGVRLCAKRPEAQRNRSTSLPRSLPFDETPVRRMRTAEFARCCCRCHVGLRS